MTAEAPQQTAKPAASRRATDAMPLTFQETTLQSQAALHHALTEGEVETIDMDSLLPHGSETEFHPNASIGGQIKPPLTPEQKKQRVQLATFKQIFADFPLVEGLSRVGIAEIKRGDILAIESIGGNIYLHIIDRIKGEAAGAGEVLCECHYDLGDHCPRAHLASIQLPICTSRHVISHPDGSQRLASRKLKINAQVTLAPAISNLLHERFFVNLAVYANPQAEKLRFVDVGRWIARMGLKLKAIIVENNRREREKKQQAAEERRRLKEARQLRKEMQREAREAGKKQR